jgi:leucyl-tRNA synthetase
VNGKMRGKVRVAIDVTQDDVMAVAMGDSAISKFVVSDIRKVVYVPKRLLNIVVG